MANLDSGIITGLDTLTNVSSRMSHPQNQNTLSSDGEPIRGAGKRVIGNRAVSYLPITNQY